MPKFFWGPTAATNDTQTFLPIILPTILLIFLTLLVHINYSSYRCTISNSSSSYFLLFFSPSSFFHFLLLPLHLSTHSMIFLPTKKKLHDFSLSLSPSYFFGEFIYCHICGKFRILFCSFVLG